MKDLTRAGNAYLSGVHIWCTAAYCPKVQHQQNYHNHVVCHEAIAEKTTYDVHYDGCHLQMYEDL